MRNEHKKIFLELNIIPRVNFLSNRDVKSHWHWNIYISKLNNKILYTESIEDKEESKLLFEKYKGLIIPTFIERLIILIISFAFIFYTIAIVNSYDILELIPVFIIDLLLIFFIFKYVFRPFHLHIGNCINGNLFLNKKLPDSIKNKIENFMYSLQ